MAKKRRYNDKFRANAVVILEAAGYPKSGALSQVSQHFERATKHAQGMGNGGK